MKNVKKFFMILMCLLLVQVTAVPDTGVITTVQAATPKAGLKKEKGKYYYYVNGKKIKNKWKTINGYKYYFGSNCAAYASAGSYKYQIVNKKINNKYYGFDSKGRMVKGDYIILQKSTGKYIFYSYSTKNGVFNSSRTKKLRNAAKQKSKAATLRALLGKPKKTYNLGGSCLVRGATDYALNYAHFELDTYKKGKTEYVNAVFPLL